MGDRGRKSLAALTIASGPIEAVQRPDAPYELTDAEADEWRAIVASQAADWFQRPNYALLVQLCRHIVAARRVAQLIEQMAGGDNFDRKEFMEFLSRQEAESRAINALLRSMRLTQQSIMRAETAKRPNQMKKPWEP